MYNIYVHQVDKLMLYIKITYLSISFPFIESQGQPGTSRNKYDYIDKKKSLETCGVYDVKCTILSHEKRCSDLHPSILIMIVKFYIYSKYKIVLTRCTAARK